MREDYFNTRELREFAYVAQELNSPADCSKRPSSKAAANHHFIKGWLG